MSKTGPAPNPGAEDRLAAVEAKLYETAIAGDITAIVAYLQAHAPETYGRPDTSAEIAAGTDVRTDPDWFGNWLRETLDRTETASPSDS